MNSANAQDALLDYEERGRSRSDPAWTELVSAFVTTDLLPHLNQQALNVAWPDYDLRDEFVQETAAQLTLGLLSDGALESGFNRKEGSLAGWLSTPYLTVSAGRYIASTKKKLKRDKAAIAEFAKRGKPQQTPRSRMEHFSPDAFQFRLCKEAAVSTLPVLCGGLQLNPRLVWTVKPAPELKARLKQASPDTSALESAHKSARSIYDAQMRELDTAFDALPVADARRGKKLNGAMETATIRYVFVPLNWEQVASLTGWGTMAQSHCSRYRRLLAKRELVDLTQAGAERINTALTRKAYERRQRGPSDAVSND